MPKWTKACQIQLAWILVWALKVWLALTHSWKHLGMLLIPTVDDVLRHWTGHWQIPGQSVAVHGLVRWGMRWAVNATNAFIIQELPITLATSPGIVLRLEEPRAQCTNIRSDIVWDSPEKHLYRPSLTHCKTVMLNALNFLVFCGIQRSSFTVLGCEHRSITRTSGHYTTLMDSVSNSLVRNMHSSSLLKVILQGSSSAPSVPPWRQGQVLLLLLGWWPSTVLTTSPCVMAGLLETPLCSWDCAGTGLQVPHLTTSSRQDNSRTYN